MKPQRNSSDSAKTLRPSSVHILARKRLSYNTRVFKQAVSLANAGYDVTIISLAEPDLPAYETTKNYSQYRVPIDPIDFKLRRQFRRAYFAVVRKTKSLFRRTIGRVYRKLSKQRKKQYLQKESHSNVGLSDQKAFDTSKPNSGNRLNSLSSTVHSAFVSFDFFVQSLRIARKSPADIYHAHDSYTLLAAYALAKLHRARFVYDAVEFSRDRNTAARQIPPVRWISQAIESFVIRRADAVMTIGDGLASLIQETFKIPQPIVVRNCPYYVGQPTNGHALQILGLESANIVLYVGSITHNNGLEELVMAAPYLHDAAVLIIGPTTYRGFDEKLKSLAAEIGAEKKVAVLGPVKPEEVVACMASAHVGVIPIQNNSLNHQYALPNKLFECITARLPIAASNLPNIRQVVESHGIGAIFDEKNPQDIARVINELLADEVAYKQIKDNLDKTATIYSWENESKRFLEAYDALADK